ncbi:MAG: hypothetical protein ACR2GZ_07650 [Solirubrobacteraceae bacterium]
MSPAPAGEDLSDHDAAVVEECRPIYAALPADGCGSERGTAGKLSGRPTA